MDVRVEQGDIAAVECDAVVVNLFQGVTVPGGATGAVDAALGGRLRQVIEAGDFRGKLGEAITLYTGGAVGAARVIVVGLGSRDGFGLEEVRRASATAARTARKLGVRHLATIVHGAGIGGLDAQEAAQATVEGAALALYDFGAYRSRAGDDEPGAGIERVTVVTRERDALEAVRSGTRDGASIAAGVALARDLANHPSNVATPTYLAQGAADLAERFGMRLEVWDRERIEHEGMGALAAVARGAAEEPRFIVLDHAPPEALDQAPRVLVGKGITFDSGGISLKPGKGMGAMKYDMSGAAAVLGTMEAVGRLDLPLRVVGIVAATENMPGGRAGKPGDIVTALNGTTVEILNTDAEGRLVLADALAYASRLRPAAVVDIATLTGAIVVALGKQAAGLFANDDDVADGLLRAAGTSGERLWRMPLWEAYAAMTKSDFADVKNVTEGPEGAGSVFGAKFLERFVDYPWAHVDIAGVAWDAKDVPYIGKGATGFGVRLFIAWLRAALSPS